MKPLPRVGRPCSSRVPSWLSLALVWACACRSPPHHATRGAEGPAGGGAAVDRVAALAVRDCPGLGVRNAHGAFAIADDVLVYGGADAETVRDDLWRLTRGAWALEPTEGPRPGRRTFPVLVGDPRGATLLFGGNPALFGGEPAPALLGDTWTLAGGRWRRHAGPSPGPRAEAAAAYDPRRRRAVLFGGYARDGEGLVRLDDTWEWDGTRWAEVRPAGEVRPSARHGAVMAYDGEQGALLLFGGSTASGPSGETWRWDGVAWRLLDALAPPLYGAAAAWSPAARRVVRFGGWDGTRRVGETWAFEGGRWRLLAHGGPSPRNHSVLITTVEGVVLVGGHDGERVFGDVWRWGDAGWSLLCASAPRRRVPNGH